MDSERAPLAEGPRGIAALSQKRMRASARQHWPFGKEERKDLLRSYCTMKCAERV